MSLQILPIGRHVLYGIHSHSDCCTTAKMLCDQQNCIPLGLTAPVSCNSLSNLTCICQNPAFTLAIADCEQTTCTAEERNGKRTPSPQSQIGSLINKSRNPGSERSPLCPCWRSWCKRFNGRKLLFCHCLTRVIQFGNVSSRSYRGHRRKRRFDDSNSGTKYWESSQYLDIPSVRCKCIVA